MLTLNKPSATWTYLLPSVQHLKTLWYYVSFVICAQLLHNLAYAIVLTGYFTPMAAVTVTWYTVPPTVFVRLKRCDCLLSETLHSSCLLCSLLSNNFLFVLDFAILCF